MARRKQPAAAVAPVGELPEHLQRGVVTVEDFVPSWEMPPDWWSSGTGDYSDRDWRLLRSWRRWQDAVTEWGVQHGLDDGELRRRGWWPGRPPPFAQRPL